MPRTLIPILALACLVLVGCEEKQEVDLWTEVIEPIDSVNRLELTEELKAVGLVSLCPPCPDTVYKYRIKVVEYQMPKGWWVKPDWFCYWCGFAEALEDMNQWPDSVFILSNPEE